MYTAWSWNLDVATHTSAYCTISTTCSRGNRAISCVRVYHTFDSSESNIVKEKNPFGVVLASARSNFWVRYSWRVCNIRLGLGYRPRPAVVWSC